nr:hypothetical protein [Pseudomonas syringae]
MRELLVAECDNAIGLESVADQFLEPESISLWLNRFGFKEFDYDVDGDSVKCDRIAINGLLTHGISDNGIKVSNKDKRKFPEKHRGNISKALAAEPENYHHAENDFSRLVAFRREAFGSSTNYIAENWLPSLTTGTLLRLTKEGVVSYHLCFTPAQTC